LLVWQWHREPVVLELWSMEMGRTEPVELGE